MKIVVFIVCILGIVRGDIDKNITTSKFKDILSKCDKKVKETCEETLKLPMKENPFTSYCVHEEIGEFKEAKPIDIKEALRVCEMLLQEHSKSKRCKNIVKKCHKAQGKGGTRYSDGKMEYLKCQNKNNIYDLLHIDS